MRTPVARLRGVEAFGLTHTLRCHRPARPGDPVISVREYWIARSSRAMTSIGGQRNRKNASALQSANPSIQLIEKGDGSIPENGVGAGAILGKHFVLGVCG